VVVDAEVNETNKSTRRSEWSSVLEKRKRGTEHSRKGLDRADIVRDGRLADKSGTDRTEDAKSIALNEVS